MLGANGDAAGISSSRRAARNETAPIAVAAKSADSQALGRNRDVAGITPLITAQLRGNDLPAGVEIDVGDLDRDIARIATAGG